MADTASVAGRVVGAGARATVTLGTGMVRVGDLLTSTMTKVDAANRAATSGAIQALHEAIGRVPTVRVVVEHADTPDGLVVAPRVRVEIDPRTHAHTMTNAADHGATAGEKEALTSDGHGHAGENHTTHDAGTAHDGHGTDTHPTPHEGANHPEESTHEHHTPPTAHDTHSGNVADVPHWVTRLLDNPKLSWKARRLFEGIKFNYENHRFYPHNEVRLADGTRADSYIPGTEIVSRKFTQFSEILDKTGKGYFEEMVSKYSPGKVIAEVPKRYGPPTMFSDANRVLAGQPLRGDMILEIPRQTRPIPQDTLDYASESRVTIRDVDGHVYN